MKNITAVSYMRITAMIMIVLYHSFCCYTGMWGMKECVIPFYEKFYLIFCFIALHSFVFISGFLYAYMTYKGGRYQNSRSFILNKIKRLLVPYCIWGLFIMLVFHQTLYDFVAGTSHLWFLLMLFGVFLVVTLTKRVWYNASLLLDCVLLSSILIVWFVKDVILGISISGTGNKSVIYLPVFFGGMLLAKYDVIQKITKMKYAVAINNAILFLLLVLLVCINQKLYMAGFLNFYCYFIPPFMLVMFYSFFIGKTLPTVFGNLDRCCMGIYILHQILISLLIIYASGSFFNYLSYWGPLFIFIISFFVSWGISSFINRYKIAAYLFG